MISSNIKRPYVCLLGTELGELVYVSRSYVAVTNRPHHLSKYRNTEPGCLAFRKRRVEGRSDG